MPLHPSYADMITTAVSSQNSHKPVSRQFIATYIQKNYSGLPDNYKKLVNSRIRKMVQDGKLTQVKQSFKVVKSVKTHPKYADMITSAIKDLAKPGGVSSISIYKQIESRYTELPKNFRILARNRIRSLVEKGVLIQNKQSFRLKN